MLETGNNPFDFKDQLFFADKSDEYKISIQVNLDGFSFSMIRIPENRLIHFNYTPARVSDEQFLAKRLSEWIYSLESVINFSQYKVNVILFTEKFTLVPQSFNTSSKESFLKMTVNLNDNNSVIYENNIHTPDSVVQFNSPPNLETCFKDFADCSILHPVKFMIDDLLKEMSENAVHVLFEANGFYIVVKKSNELQYVSNFKVNHPNDIIYYLITVIKSLKIDPEKVRLLVSGEIKYTDLKFNMIKNIFPNHSFYRPFPGISNQKDIPGDLETRFIIHFI